MMNEAVILYGLFYIIRVTILVQWAIALDALKKFQKITYLPLLLCVSLCNQYIKQSQKAIYVFCHIILSKRMIFFSLGNELLSSTIFIVLTSRRKVFGYFLFVN